MKINLLIEGIQLINTGFFGQYYKLNAKDREFVVNYYASMENIPYEEADKMFSDFLTKADINLKDWSKNDLIQVIKISIITDFEILPYRAKNTINGIYYGRTNPLDVHNLYRAIKYCQEHVFNNTEVNNYNECWLSNELYRAVTLTAYDNYYWYNKPISSADKFFNHSIADIAQKEDHKFEFVYVKSYIEQYFDDFRDISANAMVRLLELHLADDRKYIAQLNFEELLDAVKSEVRYSDNLNQVIDKTRLDGIVHNYCKHVNFDERENYINRAYEPVKNVITKFFSNIEGQMTYQMAIQLIHNRIDHTGIFAPKPKNANMFQKLVRIFK